MYQRCHSFAASCNINPGAYVLINEHYSYVLPPLRKVVEGLPNRRVFGFGVNYEKVLLGFWRLSDMLCITYQFWVIVTLRVSFYTPIPASKRPVTES